VAEAPLGAAGEVRVLEVVRRRIRVRHDSIRTEGACVDWSRRFVVFLGKRHPRDLGPAELSTFLTHLAVERGVALATQGQAKAPLLFLYRTMLGLQLPWLEDIVAAKNSGRLPLVLTRVAGRGRLLRGGLDGLVGLQVALRHGTGMRLLEGLRLRVERLKLTRRGYASRVGEGARGPRDDVAREPGSGAAAATRPGARAAALARPGSGLGQLGWPATTWRGRCRCRRAAGRPIRPRRCRESALGAARC
jgi:hypothetical protein